METLVMEFVLPFAIIAVMYFWLGRFPEPYPKSKNTRREIAEVLGLWLLVFVALTAFMLSLPADAFEGMPSNSLLLSNIAYMIFPLVIVPFFYVVYVQKWTRADLGIRMPRAWPLAIFAVALFALSGLLPFLSGQTDSLPWSLLAFAIYQPAFTEEVFFRVVFQGKLERALGQKWAWFYSGILFGLMHVPVDFFGPQWYQVGESYLAAVVMLFSQIFAGWIFGLIYSKTRSIFPGMLAHFMADARLSSVVLNLMP
jgi:membrane protease YdiL (CAAX protease family)